MRRPGEILIASFYEQGHQPLAAATALAFLERAGFHPRAVDLAVEPVERLLELAGSARLVLLSVPMHTALRLGVKAAARLRGRAPRAHLCFFGLYAGLNAEHLLGGAADSVVSGEVESALVGLAEALEGGAGLDTVSGLARAGAPARPVLERLSFPPPARSALPPLQRYAALVANGTTRVAAAVEASRGCLHTCRHCPIPPVYGGRFFVVPREVVLADIRAVVGAGAGHITFADPDFLNGPRHALELVRALHAEFPELTFDATTKVEHVLRQRRMLPELARSGCLFLVSAVESLSDTVLAHLDKGHTGCDAREAAVLLREAGITLRPSLLPFTPWSTHADFVELLEWIGAEELIGCVDPVQYSIRLLVPPGSLLEHAPALRPFRGELDRERLSWNWVHPDPAMDRLQQEVAAIARRAAQSGERVEVVFEQIRQAAQLRPTRGLPARAVADPPRLTEPWFC